MPRINIRRILVLAGILSLGLSYTLLWARMITTPREYTGTDFVAFYSAGRIAANEGPEHAYDVSLQKRYQEQLVGFEISSDIVRIYLNPPFVIPLVSLIMLEDFVPSLILWELLMGLYALLGTWLLFSSLRPVYPRQEWPVILAGMILFFPIYKSLVIGQNSAMLYFGACIWLLGLLSGKDWMAGLGLAAMTVRPHLVLPLALPFLFRQRKVWWWFLAGAGGLALFSLLYCGLDGIEGFLRILGFSASAVNATTGEDDMNNLLGLLIRLLPGVDTGILRGISWGAYLLNMAGLCLLWGRVRKAEKKHISLAVITTIFTVPHFHFHDFALLVVPITCLMLFIAEGNYLSSRQAAVFPLAISFLLFCCFFADFLKENIPYLLMAALLAPQWYPDKFFRPAVARPLGPSG